TPAPATPAPATTDPAPPTGGERTIIRLAVQGDSTPATRALLDAFNDSQDNYYVYWVEMTNDSAVMREQLLTSLRAGSAEYDVVSLDVVWAGEFASAGFIEPLDVFMQNSGLRVPQFNAGSMASGRYSARQFVLPFFPDLGFLYFRSDIVSAENYARLVSGNFTFEELYEMANTYMGEGGTTYGMVYQSALYEGLTCNINEFTSNWTDIRGGLEMMRRFTDSDITPANILNFTEGETHNAFIHGQVVFARNWPYQWGMVASEGTIDQSQVSVAPLPGGGTVGGWLLAMNANSENKDGAWALMEFMATHEGQQIFSTVGGYLPGFNDTLNDPAVIAGNELLTKEGFQNALLTTIARPVSAEYARVSDQIQRATHGFLAGSVDLDTAVSEIEAALAE
ncbi:MAG: extracellular solute-binding protein, partial [Defluviitaleaceae bacterium]|nr:extracellular solute-binding protein [Defluviitaleaceae bacterium]